MSTSQIPYLLTANHCINRDRDASNLQAYFQFTIPCGMTNCPAQTHPGGIQRLGATIKATGTGGDFTLMQLNTDPPSGSVFLGWNRTPIANTNNALLYRISHPAWAPQAYSAGHVDTSAPTCTQWPRGERIYSRTTAGGTEGGSSGSPVVNVGSEVVGPELAGCLANVHVHPARFLAAERGEGARVDAEHGDAKAHGVIRTRKRSWGVGPKAYL